MSSSKTPDNTKYIALDVGPIKLRFPQPDNPTYQNLLFLLAGAAICMMAHRQARK